VATEPPWTTLRQTSGIVEIADSATVRLKGMTQSERTVKPPR